MSQIKKIFLYITSSIIWAYWWTLAIVFISSVIGISFILPKRYHEYLVSFICKTLTYSICLKPQVIYKCKNLPFPVIFVANHVSFFDLFISGSVLPGNPRGLELSDHFKKPFYGWFLTRFGQIPIKNGDRRSLIESLNKITKILKNKERNILVMPEGHRTRNGKVGEFKTGAFYLARKINIPVVPVVYKGLYERAKKGFILKPGKFKVIILEPLYPNQFNSDDEMAKVARDIISKELENTIIN